jgi:hypothetical protein
VKRQAVKKQHVPRLKRDKLFRGDQRLIDRQVWPEERRLVELFGLILQAMRAGDHLQTAVVLRFRTKGDPGVDQLRTLEGPVANVLMPAGFAAEIRVLGHDAVMVGQRADNLRAE